MASLDRPKLRPLSAQRFEHQGQTYAAIADPLGVFLEPVLIPIDGYQWVVRHFDGETLLSEIQARVLRETGQLITLAQLEELVDQLDRAMVLDGPTFAAYHESYRRAPVRPAAMAGRSYAGTERALRAQLARFFCHADGSGVPQLQTPTIPSRLRGVLSPHIDFQRGGPVYTWSYKELVERSDADTFVILGVAHQYCRNRFALTRKDFETPLGRVRTNGDYVDRIAALAGHDLFEDELSHRTEHSIEFQVVFLQYLLGGIRDFSIVPILVGSFHDLMDAGTDPIESDDVRRFVESLRAAEAAHGRKVAYIGGIDLCHVGPEFGDPDLLDPEILAEVRSFDTSMLDRAVARDPAGWFGTAAEIGNRWRVCGLAAAYTMLHAMGPARGTLLKYDQAVDEGRTCCVSFASLAFDAHDEPSPSAEVRTCA
ncbi:hypothetical protein SAMN05444166_7707 [Singulisphaera sp. GP187]|uniref:AmmeMemoRadiSam system protein B n=1 Tax=Singulisphaera sp. GP187 TaxID=1882752 RepID=UPI0009296FCE|nr:AmmeMemoRadiSam system protein B [Singulisphaera sp. GP187]SIO65481.1 hypothetical protein SAMN05444166_7707 [Singulisphaera sp. GP187]